VKQIAKFIILVIFAQSISLGTYAAGLAFENNDTSVHASHEVQINTGQINAEKSCDEMLECGDNCYDCCHCIMLLQSHFENHIDLQTLNNFPFLVSIHDLPNFLYKPPRSLHS